MKTTFLTIFCLCAGLLLAACSTGPLPPASQDSAGAPLEQPTATPPANSQPDQPNAPSPQGEPAFSDSFTGGNPQLSWAAYPYFNQDNLRGSTDPSSPETEKGVGVLTNENAGGFATLSYVDMQAPADFYLETWLYTTVTKEDQGQLNGIAFKVDPENNRFYRFATRFGTDPSMSLAYVGADVQNFPVSLGAWKGSDIPGGPPTESGWHKVVIKVVNNKADVYWDSHQLSGGPFDVDLVPDGYVGVYGAVTGGMGLAETKVAAFKVYSAGPGLNSQTISYDRVMDLPSSW